MLPWNPQNNVHWHLEFTGLFHNLSHYNNSINRSSVIPEFKLLPVNRWFHSSSEDLSRCGCILLRSYMMLTCNLSYEQDYPYFSTNLLVIFLDAKLYYRYAITTCFQHLRYYFTGVFMQISCWLHTLLNFVDCEGVGPAWPSVETVIWSYDSDLGRLVSRCF